MWLADRVDEQNALPVKPGNADISQSRNVCCILVNKNGSDAIVCSSAFKNWRPLKNLRFALWLSNGRLTTGLTDRDLRPKVAPCKASPAEGKQHQAEVRQRVRLHALAAGNERGWL